MTLRVTRPTRPKLAPTPRSRGRYSLTRGRAPTNEELLAAAKGLLALGLFVLTLLLIMQWI